LLAHAHANFIRTIGDHGGPGQLPAGLWCAERSRQFEWLSEVAVAARHGDDGAGWEDARTNNRALVDGALEPESRPTHVANGREPAHQRGSRLSACHEIEMTDVPREQCGRRRPHHHCVPVHVDQPGHQRAPATVDEHGGGASIGRDRSGGDTLDLIPAHQDVSRP
jgi:hypothetical protein